MITLIGTDTYHPDVNGASYFSQRLADGLAGLGHVIHVVSPARTGTGSVAVRVGVTEHRLASWPVCPVRPGSALPPRWV